MRELNSMMTLVTLSGLGFWILAGSWPTGDHSGRFRAAFFLIDDLIHAHGPMAVGNGLIFSGCLLACFWMIYGSDR